MLRVGRRAMLSSPLGSLGVVRRRLACLGLVVVALYALVGVGPTEASPNPTSREAPTSRVAPALRLADIAVPTNPAGQRQPPRNPWILRFLEAFLPILGVVAFALLGAWLIYWILEEQKK
jgi:hypothetical protein